MNIQVQVASVELTCPKCGSDIASPSGSLFWMVSELPDSVQCFSCYQVFTLPKQYRANH